MCDELGNSIVQILGRYDLIHDDDANVLCSLVEVFLVLVLYAHILEFLYTMNARSWTFLHLTSHMRD